jgi:two-component system nitrate/nitrite response regulator NarL
VAPELKQAGLRTDKSERTLASERGMVSRAMDSDTAAAVEPRVDAPSADRRATEERLTLRPVRLVLASGVRIYRDSLAELLGADVRLDVVARASGWDTCLDALATHAPEVVLLDLRLAPRGIDLRSLRPVKVVALAVDGAEGVIECGEAGAAGYVTVDDSIARAVERILSAHRGEVDATPNVAARLLARLGELHAALPPRVASLTRRECEIAGLVGAGLSNKEIASRLHIEVATVKNHVHNIIAKSGACDRRGAAERVRAPEI